MEPDKIIILVYMLFNSILGCLFNLVVLLVYFKYSKNYPSVILLSLLALSNFLCSIIVMPIVIITELDIIQKDNMYCGFYYLIRYLSASFTIKLLALIAFECLENIKNPVKVEISFKTKVLCLILLVIVMIFSVLAYFCYHKNKYNKCREYKEFYLTQPFGYASIAILIIMMLFILICYLKIYKIVRQSFRKVTINFEISAVESSNFNSRFPRNQTRKHWRIAQKVILVIKKIFCNTKFTNLNYSFYIKTSLIYCVVWLPFIVFKLIPDLFPEPSDYEQLAIFFNDSLCFIYPTICPIVYSFWSKIFRNDFMKLFE